ncbi:hypothetical protein ACOJ97_004818 [Escherichia coli]|nr:hypothetical protein [Escherichia coli]
MQIRYFADFVRDGKVAKPAAERVFLYPEFCGYPESSWKEEKGNNL